MLKSSVAQNRRVLPPSGAALRPLKLSHGTLTCRDLDVSRRFYEDFLGLECVRHQRQAMVVTHGREWAIVCVQIGEKVEARPVLHHFGIDVESDEEVDRAHALATARRDDWELRRIQPVAHQHGTYAFYLQDRDYNWWEVQHVGGYDYAALFARGDVDLTPAPGGGR